MAVPTREEIDALSLTERLALIDDLWESVEMSSDEGERAAPITEHHRRLLDERLLDLETSPDDEISLSEARSQSYL